MIKRRDFLRGALGLASACTLGSLKLPAGLPGKVSAGDRVKLGSTGIEVSRLSMGCGTHGVGGHSNQSALDIQGLSDTLSYCFDQGITLWDTADAYGTHPHVREALRKVGRNRVVITTKSWSRTADGIANDLERYLKELGADHVDIFLLHCLTEPDWPQRMQGAMEVLAREREKGMIRAHGVSCHSIGALRAAARNPWVMVDLARLNPASLAMDADPPTVISVLREMRAQGKGVYCMKIVGGGRLPHARIDESLTFALASGAVDAFTIGFESKQQVADIVGRLSRLA